MVGTLTHPHPDDPPSSDASAASGAADADRDHGDERAWRRALGVGLATFAVSRVIVMLAAYGLSQIESLQRWNRGLPIAESTRQLIERHFIQWDGRWYKLIAEDGYQADLPETISYIPDNGGATVAFFPVYPYLSRWFDYVFPGGIDQAMLGINIVLSIVAVVLVGVLAREAYDIATAERAMILFSLFPGAVVMSWSYSEPALIAFAAACLLFLMRKQWLLAGLFAALATATRPNGLALVAACAVAAAIAIYRERAWRSLVSVALAPVGMLLFMWYLRVHTGESNAWMRAQREAWDEGYSWGATAVRYVWRFAENPLGTRWGPLYMHTTLAVVLLAFGLFCAVRKKLPLPWLAYTAGIGFFMLVPSVVSARPRFVFTAFPLAIAVAAWWPRRPGIAWESLVLVSAGSLAVFTMMYGGWVMIP